MSRTAYYAEEQQRLPEHFADTVLELEIKADSEECDLATIQKLNEMYRVHACLPVDRHRVLRDGGRQEGCTLSEEANADAHQSDHAEAD